MYFHQKSMPENKANFRASGKQAKELEVEGGGVGGYLTAPAILTVHLGMAARNCGP